MCACFYKCHFLSKTLLNFGCIDGSRSRSMNKSQIFKFEKLSDLELVSKNFGTGSA